LAIGPYLRRTLDVTPAIIHDPNPRKDSNW